MGQLSFASLCVVAVWDAIDHAPAFAALVALLDRVAGTAAGDALRAPFVLGDRSVLATLFNGAGAEFVSITTRQGTARFSSAREFVEAEVKGWLPVMGVTLPQPTIDRIVVEAENMLAEHATPDGELAFKISSHIVSSGKP